MSDAPTVVVLGGGPPRPALVEALGADRTAALRRCLEARAVAWARAAFPGGTVRTVDDDPDAALAAALAPASGPRIVIAPELADWPAALAAAVIEDLRAGCAVTIGPVFDGGLYLLGLAPAPAASAPEPAPSTLAEALRGEPGGLGGRHVMTALIGLAEREGWEVGLLRTERGVRGPRDVRALLADPLTDAELRAVLG